MNAQSESIRIFPANWLDPMQREDCCADPSRPLEIDLGCGKGRFLLARAERFPEMNFLGVDRMLRRIRKIDNKARRRNLENIRLMRIDAYYATAYLVPTASVAVYYIFFPDPWPKKRHHKYRIMNPLFLDALHRTLEPGGRFHFATDHLPYFDDVMEWLVKDERFQQIETFEPIKEERTDFELYYLDKKQIGRSSFQMK